MSSSITGENLALQQRVGDSLDHFVREPRVVVLAF
jgi:hypothetical protein